ncbi:MAG: Alkanal monooxygenase alpha chain, partial [uncultured Nocardioides sp.]
EEHRVPVVRPLDAVAAVADALGLRHAAAVHRPRRGGRGAGGGRRVLPGAPLRPAALRTVPAARCRRRPDQPHRDRHRCDRHALREPALHGRGRGHRRPDRGRSPPARHQPGITGAGRRRLPVLRLPARRGLGPCRDGARAHPGLPRGDPGPRVRRAEPAADVPQPARAAARRAALAGAARAHLVGRRLACDRRVDRAAGHEPDELDPAHRGHRRALPPAPGRAGAAVPGRLEGGRPRPRAAGLGEPEHLPDRRRPRPRLLRPGGDQPRPGGSPRRRPGALRQDVRRRARPAGRRPRQGRGDRRRRHAAADGAQPARRRLQRPPHRESPHPRGPGGRLAL